MLNLDMRQLEYFVVAASSGSYSAAAKRLFVSPQAISKGVQVLERRIGIPLFERGPNGIAPTPFGMRFYEEAQLVLDSLERLQNMADQYQQEHAASLKAGIHSLCFKEHGGSIDWNDLLRFHDEHRNMDPSFVEMRGDSIISSVEDGSLDFGISVLSSKNLQSFEYVLLRDFPLAAIVSTEEHYFETRDSVFIHELAQGQLVLFSEEDAFNSFFIERARQESTFIDVSPLQIRTDSDVDFVIDRRLYTVRPQQHAIRTTRSKNVRILPILDAGEQDVAIPLYLFWKRGRKPAEPEAAFVETIMNMYRPAH